MSLQRLIVRGLLSLPAPVLGAMSKKAKVKEVDGRVLDPGMAVIAAQSADAPPVTAATPAEARAATHDAFTMMNGPRAKGVAVSEFSIPGPGGSLAVRHYWKPGNEERVPLVVYFHMGGCVIGDLDTCDTFCSQLVSYSGVTVLSVDYRLAPEHKFPAAVEDALAAYEWALENAGHLGGRPDCIAVGGDSAGGYLSAVVTQEMKRRGNQMPAAQLLIYPWLDMTATGGSMESCAQCSPLDTATMEWFAAHYMRDTDDKTQAFASPGLAEDLSGLPPTLLYTAGFDPLRDQGEAFARRIEKTGQHIVFREYSDLPHAFTAMSGISRRARNACLEIARDLKKALGGAGA